MKRYNNSYQPLGHIQGGRETILFGFLLILILHEYLVINLLFLAIIWIAIFFLKGKFGL